MNDRCCVNAAILTAEGENKFRALGSGWWEIWRWDVLRSLGRRACVSTNDAMECA